VGSFRTGNRRVTQQLKHRNTAVLIPNTARNNVLQIRDEKVPLSTDQSGVSYVAGTRVTLDCVVEMFDDGASPEEIVEQYDVLQLADVYAVITYLLRNGDQVAAYLSRQGTVSEARRQTIDNEFPQTLRAKLLKARRNRKSG
jgi:uncharacterized protein (DUF433 family)